MRILEKSWIANKRRRWYAGRGDHGITTFYVADKYNKGVGEEFLGAAVRPRRDDVVLVIKTGYRVAPMRCL